MIGHGWVTPNANGVVARCGGPKMCAVCQAELMLAERKALQKRNDLPARSDLPKVGSIWRHYKGGHYKVILIANDQSTFPERFPVSVVYQSAETLYIWTRPLEQWLKSMTLVEFGDEIRGKEITHVYVDESSEQFDVLKRHLEEPNNRMLFGKFEKGRSEPEKK